MKNLGKYRIHIIIGILLIAGALFALISNNTKVQGGGACVTWGISILLLALIGRKKQQEELDVFDIEATEILEDIAEKGEKSPYFQFYNIDIIKKKRKKLVRKQIKQTTTCIVLGVVLIITAIICIV